MVTDALALRRLQRRTLWHERLSGRVRVAGDRIGLVAEGTLTRVVGLALEAVGCEAAMGGRCVVVGGDGRELETEVVGFSGDRLFLMPVGDVHGITPNSRVIPRPGHSQIAVGDGLLGRVIDAGGKPLDGRGPLHCEERIALSGAPINPMDRHPISEPIDVGVRAINAIMTVGRGQRMGLLAGSGVGKSTLLGMMTRYTDADVIVVGLIGERGREVKEFVDNTLGESGRKRAVVVAAPADSPPLSRLRGAWVATAIAEYFRDRGQKVLLLMDSLTRFAQAQREIALAIGEPPATKGYPPSVFARLPALIERAGNGASGRGSITAIYTVLTEGDDYRHDPIADAARAILDGQVVLSRDLAEAAHFPAIDLEGSVSRAMDAIVPKQHVQSAQRLRQLYSAYRQQRDLIAVGAYQKGSDPRVDEAIARWPEISAFLQQSVDQRAGLAASVQALDQVLAGSPGVRK